MAACVSLQGSKTCLAFQSASVDITPGSKVVGFFPFLQFVSSAETFDTQLQSWVATDWVQKQYGARFGCQDVTLTNTSDLYARFTTTVMCNSIIQNSISTCGLSAEDSRPVCAESCAQYGTSEYYIVKNKDLCSNPISTVQEEIKSDSTICSLPADSLSGDLCVPGIANEPDNCGYGNSTIGLCTYCASGGLNSTDTCCYSSNAEGRCANVVLPTISPPTSLTTASSTTSSTPAPTSSSSSTPAVGAGDDTNRSSGLSSGAIAGIVIGSLIGVAALALLLWFCCRRRRPGSQDGSIFNQPSPSRKGLSTAQMAQAQDHAPQGFDALPGGRIARMSALEGRSGSAPSQHTGRDFSAVSALGAAGGYSATSRRRGDDHSSSDGYSPVSDRGTTGVLRPPPTTNRRNGSLSSGSMLGEDAQSPMSGDMSSPQGMASQQSEQLPFFKDYYSQDDIHPGDRVAVLWAYQPRAADEFSLDRGDMLKVVGIWDDGWATGILVDENAEDWEARRQAQRDSGVSNTSGRLRDASPPVSGEIKAFPLVCVCLPEHWRKTIDGDSSTEGSSALHHSATTGS
ncbi:hypothetical protein B0T17DRAFT_487406 [Bombardia bombarda]|uniref:SH3 domain-containing protein n=1 Tax=Bombardia bombarda TaxID=252184 RepID=A0AA39X999_9PEZI|nr:hypothetical protein B0T17DRAFT_487406 [Bombardia bombarda]